MPSEEEYKLLPHIAGDDDYFTDASLKNERDVEHVVQRRMAPTYLRWVVLVQWGIILILLLVVVHPSLRPSKSSLCGQLLYSPAQNEIEYETRLFNVSFPRNTTIYSSDPSPEVDQAWNDLYNDYGTSQVPKSEAVRLPVMPEANAEHPEEYPMVLSVFHQLHCLNTIRKLLNPEYYTDPATGFVAGLEPETIPDHAGHCIDMLRQGVQCSADLTPLVWNWSEELQQSLVVMHVEHSCKNWDRIENWARVHQGQHEYNRSMHAVPAH